MMTVAIFGESPLVEEYATLCLSKGMKVLVRVNGGAQAKSGHIRLPKGTTSITRPTKSVHVALELTNISADAKRANLQALDKALPASACVLTSSVTVTIAEQSTWVRNAGRLVGIGALPSLLDGELIEVATSHTSASGSTARAEEFIRTLGKEPARVSDGVGMVLPRILCMLANEAYFAMMEGVAGGQEIDTAMKLGTNYPCGPVEWVQRIGVKHVHAVLAALHASFGEDRYRTAQLLRQSALLADVRGH